MRTRIYEDNSGHMFAVIMNNGEVTKIVSGLECDTTYTMKDVLADAIDGFADWDGECHEPPLSPLSEVANDIRHYSKCVADIGSTDDGSNLFVDAVIYWTEMGVAAKAIFGEMK